MTFDEFNAIVAACRMQQPIWFELETDQPASDSEIEDAQRALAAMSSMGSLRSTGIAKSSS